MQYVYVLWSEKLKKRYVGSTGDVDKRIIQHKKGKNRFTKGGIPWKLVHKEEYESLSLARKREVFLKSSVGRNWLDNYLPLFSRKGL